MGDSQLAARQFRRRWNADARGYRGGPGGQRLDRATTGKIARLVLNGPKRSARPSPRARGAWCSTGSPGWQGATAPNAEHLRVPSARGELSRPTASRELDDVATPE